MKTSLYSYKITCYMLKLRSQVFFTLFIVMASLSNLASQNAVFSMYDNTFAYLNPANTGDFVGNWRGATSYRSKGYGLSEPYTTSVTSFENHFYYYSQMINIGFVYLNDNSASRTFPLNEFGVSLAQDVRVNQLAYFRLGIQLCFSNRQFTLDGQTFPEQYDRNIGGYNPQLPMSESFASTSTSYLKVNVGSTYFINNSYHLKFGVAARQLNRPIESFYGQDNRLGVQWSATFSSLKNLGSSYFVKPSVNYNYQQQNGLLLISCGGGLYVAPNEFKLQSFFGGVVLRYGTEGQVQDFGINLGLTANNWTIQMGHDFNVSSQQLNLAPSSAMEISIIYTRPSTEPHVRTVSNQRF